MFRAAIVGTTSWGTTLGIVLARQGVDVLLLSRTADEAEGLESARENERFVPGACFPERLHVTADPRVAMAGADIVRCAKCHSYCYRLTWSRMGGCPRCSETAYLQRSNPSFHTPRAELSQP